MTCLRTLFACALITGLGSIDVATLAAQTPFDDLLTTVTRITRTCPPRLDNLPQATLSTRAAIAPDDMPAPIRFQSGAGPSLLSCSWFRIGAKHPIRKNDLLASRTIAIGSPACSPARP